MILIFEQDLTDYRAAFYDYFSGMLKEEVLILYGEGEPNSHHTLIDSSLNRKFKIQKIHRKWIGRSLYYQSFKIVKEIVEKNNISCIIHRGAIRNISLFRELIFFRKKKIPIVLRGFGFSVKRKFNPRINPIDKYHKLITNYCDAFLCYTPGGKKLLDKYYSPEKIFVGINTLNSNLLFNHYKILQHIGKNAVKMELGLNKENYIIHIGRMSPRKKLDKLLKIYGYSKKSIPSIGLILVGDGPSRKSLERQVREMNLSDVIFTGSLSSENILASKYLYASDIMVIPGNIGLSINHAFLFGKPVIGQVIEEGEPKHKDYIQTPEHEYLQDGYNGINVSSGQIKAFHEAIVKILAEPDYGTNAMQYAKDFLTVQKMAAGYISAMEYAMKKKVELNKPLK